MGYEKPEVAVLGDAVRLIQGSKQQIGEAGGQVEALPDCELDD